MKTMRALLVFLLTTSAVAADIATPVVHVTGVDGKTSDFTVDQFRRKFAVKPVDYSVKGDSHQADCVPLVDVVKTAGVATDLKMDPKIDPKIKNYNLRLVVVVRGDDGYTITLSVGELLPDIGNHPAYLAVGEAGKPNPEKYGPVELIVPEDEKPGRRVRHVSSITVVDAAGPTTRPS